MNGTYESLSLVEIMYSRVAAAAIKIDETSIEKNNGKCGICSLFTYARGQH